MNTLHLAATCLAVGLWLWSPGGLAAGYAIEVLVFQNLNSNDSEVTTGDVGSLDLLGTTEYPAASLGLTGVAQRLRQSGGYRVLAHKAWIQPAGRSTPTAIRGTEAGGALEGTVRVERRRFLHVSVDLVFQDPSGFETVRMTGARRMRSKELHYLDHPKLGVLTIARPL
jgi:hypothetical protein